MIEWFSLLVGINLGMVIAFLIAVCATRDKK